MNKLIVIILLVYCGNVFGDGNDNKNQESSDFRGIGNYGYSQVWIDPKKYLVNWLSNRGQKYPGIWIGDKNGQGGYDNDDYRYGQNGDSDSNVNDGYIGRNGGYNNNNRYVQGIRIGVNGYVGNQFNNYDVQERNGQRSQEYLRAELLLNARQRAGLGLNAGIRAGLGLNAGLRAGLGLNAGLALGTAAGLSLGAGLIVGLDLSSGGGKTVFVYKPLVFGSFVM